MAHAARQGPFAAIPVAVVLVALLLLAACRREAPEAALRASLADLEDAVEARDAGAIEDVLAADFAGPDGMDRPAARRLAQLAFLRNPEVAVAIGPLDVRFPGDDADPTHATVAFTAALAGGTGRWLPESGSVYRVETGWRREGGDWRLASARWERDL